MVRVVLSLLDHTSWNHYVVLKELLGQFGSLMQRWIHRLPLYSSGRILLDYPSGHRFFLGRAISNVDDLVRAVKN